MAGVNGSYRAGQLQGRRKPAQKTRSKTEKEWLKYAQTFGLTSEETGVFSYVEDRVDAIVEEEEEAESLAEEEEEEEDEQEQEQVPEQEQEDNEEEGRVELGRVSVEENLAVNGVGTKSRDGSGHWEQAELMRMPSDADGPSRSSSSISNIGPETSASREAKAVEAEVEVDDLGEHLIRPYLEPGEKIKHRYNCERVVGLDKRDGIFLIGELGLYILENWYVDAQGCIREKEHEGDLSVLDVALGVKQRQHVQHSPSAGPIPSPWTSAVEAYHGGVGAWAGAGTEELWSSLQQRGGAGEQQKRAHQVVHESRTWRLDSVHELLKRRYQLRPVAIELFSMSGVNDLLVFHAAQRDECFKNLVACNLPRNSMLDATISGSTAEAGEPGRLFRNMTKSFGKRWQNGELSNFQYLMHLNTLAGRGYNDLTQYPVFPWVLADYHSADLDLSSPATFRRLDKPMGALTDEREVEFQKRYDNWEDAEIPKFHYGSHYSSAGIVLYYLIRLPPFSVENQHLQGGHFDHADRLFQSVGDTWRSASCGNTADVKELIPEFFYLPEFLENRFSLDLGAKQSGEKVGDVALPPWAHGSVREFVRVHRQALESAYVSEHLHEWIDLIFGYQQQGRAAVEATNVFFYLTYEGAVDVDAITDASTKASILAQINNFGQTPRQLFLKPHPRRRLQRPVSLALMHFPYLRLLEAQEIRHMPSSVSQILMIKDKLGVLVGDSLMRPPAFDCCFLWGFCDSSLRLVATDADRLLATHEALHDGGPVQCVAVSRDGTVLATGGADGLVSVWRPHVDSSKGQRRLEHLRSLCAHTQAVTKLALCQPWGMLVSGSNDGTAIVWDLNKLEFVRQLSEMPGAITGVCVNETTGDIVVSAGTTLGVWSINGDCLAMVHTSLVPSEAITCVCIYDSQDWKDNGHVVTGHRHGGIRLWAVEAAAAVAGDDDVVPTATLSVRERRSNSIVGERLQGAATLRTLPSLATLVQDPTGADLRSLAEEFLAAAEPQAGAEGEHGHGHSQSASGSFVPRRTPQCCLVLLRELPGWHKQPVTALLVSSDFQQMFSGDQGGRVARWALPDHFSPEQLQLEASSTCMLCRRKTGHAAEKKQLHCFNCGRAVCAPCGGAKQALEELGYLTPVRICRECHDVRSGKGVAHSLGRSPTLLPPSLTSSLVHHHRAPIRRTTG